jgi:hypothetical protein
MYAITENMETSATIDCKGMRIEIDYTKSDNTENMNVFACGEYNHTIEIEFEEDYLYLTWVCDYHKELIADIITGQRIDNNIDSFKTFLSEYFPVLDDYESEYDINITDRGALKEIILIMEQVFEFDPKEH